MKTPSELRLDECSNLNFHITRCAQSDPQFTLGNQLDSTAIVNWQLEQKTIEQPAPGHIFKEYNLIANTAYYCDCTLGISPGKGGMSPYNPIELL